MSDAETVERAKPFDNGTRLYQQRARAALPLLVRQAKAGQTIYYGDLAEELGMPNAKNLNYVLGSIGQALIKLGEKQGKTIPPIQCLVVNRSTGLPGEGIKAFIEKEDYKSLSKMERRRIVKGQLRKIFHYRKWDEVLKAFSLKPAPLGLSESLRKAAQGGRGGGESEHHKKLKEHVASHPEILGLPASTKTKSETEYLLPSGDKVDVLFRRKAEWIPVEVKSHISEESDLIRGLFQCVKYQAVLEAFLLSEGLPANVRTVMVTARALPPKLVSLRNVLAVEVICVQKLD